MAKRTKRKVKARSKSHKKYVGTKRKRRVGSRSKVGFGSRKRRKKARAKKK